MYMWPGGSWRRMAGDGHGVAALRYGCEQRWWYVAWPGHARLDDRKVRQYGGHEAADG
jgi:hypothetical protein